MLGLPLLFRRLGQAGLGAGGCLVVLLVMALWTAFVVFVGGWFWGDVVYNHIFNHPFTHHALTRDQWLLVGVALVFIAG